MARGKAGVLGAQGGGNRLERGRVARFHRLEDGWLVGIGALDPVAEVVGGEIAIEAVPSAPEAARGSIDRQRERRTSARCGQHGNDRHAHAARRYPQEPGGGDVAERASAHVAVTTCLGTVAGQPERWWPCAVCLACGSYLGPREVVPDAAAWLAGAGTRTEPYPGADEFLRSDPGTYAAWVGVAGLLALRAWREETEALRAEVPRAGAEECRWCGSAWATEGDAGAARLSELARHAPGCPWRQLREAEREPARHAGSARFPGSGVGVPRPGQDDPS